MARPLAVAITGGIGAGKSEALAAFARHGAAVISSDDIVHRLLREDVAVREALRERFGDAAFGEDGEVDRSKLAELVFADREALDWLEGLLHPLVVQEYMGWRERLAELDDPPRVSATEVPLLYEVGGQERFDAVVVVTAPPEVRGAPHGGGGRRTRAPPAARRGEGRSGGLRLRQRRLAREARRLRAGGVAGADEMKKLLALVLVGAALGAAFAYVHSTEPGWYVRLRYPLRYQAIVRGHARNYRLDPALLAGVIYQESKFHAHARSSSGAIGLMQLLPDTAKGIAIHTGGSRFEVSDLDDPEINVRYGSWYLRHLLDKYGNERTALAAYNAGQENVDTWRREGKGIAFAETRHYVKRVEHLKTLYRRGYAKSLYPSG